ncbi:rhox homeobox family member 2 [Cricetulus griseus]|uniref:Rhox homeobox family member 2 n=2 Tax=Cricetulus griseus TaxID=10029 RepID=A0A3L7H676_CRIGR|nr:rhox homeobox family member 2 [Cricetulus griseus]XP_027287735.1 rhox homeobox family member 2 [Cricetulus griseus]
MESIQGMKLLLAQEERNEEESGHGEPATQGESERGLSGEGHSAAAASGLVDDDMNKDGGGARAGQESEQQPNEPIPGGMDGETVQSVPRQVPRRRLHHRFTQWQLEELERIFQTNCFFSIEARKQLARWMGVNEATVKRWFQKRREQYRRYKRL